MHDDLVEVYGAMILRVKARMDAGEDVPDCLAKTLLEHQEKENLDWEDVCMLTAVFTLGGVHSVSTFFCSLGETNVESRVGLGYYSVVPGVDPVAPRNPSTGTRRT